MADETVKVQSQTTDADIDDKKSALEQLSENDAADVILAPE